MRSLMCPSSATRAVPSPTRTALKPQVFPERVTVPEPLAATPRNLPLKVLNEAVRSPLASKPRPDAPSVKLTLPGRSARSAPGLMPLT